MYQLKAKHKKRDLGLPNKRREILNRIEEDLCHDDNIVAIFYGGSIGSETTDQYSDIDLRIVVKSGAYPEYKKNQRERAAKWGNILFFESLPEESYTVAHFDSFVKVDAFYYRNEDLKPSVWFQKIKIVHDPYDVMSKIVKESNKLTYKPTKDDFIFWRNKFLAYLHESYRRQMRNEKFYTLQCVDKMRWLIAAGWYMETGVQPNSLGDWAKIEGDNSELKDWQLERLKSWNSDRDNYVILNVIDDIVVTFKEVHQSICEKFGFEDETELVDNVIDKVM
jgi:hypothetical protein